MNIQSSLSICKTKEHYRTVFFNNPTEKTHADLCQYNKCQWVLCDSILEDLEETIVKGNVDGGGFSPALWISKIKKVLEKKR